MTCHIRGCSCRCARWAVNSLLFLWLGLLIYLCAVEIPTALDKDHADREARVMARCVSHGDYNMADAFCAAAAKGMGQ